jgi:hypothetical protein
LLNEHLMDNFLTKRLDQSLRLSKCIFSDLERIWLTGVQTHRIVEVSEKHDNWCKIDDLPFLVRVDVNVFIIERVHKFKLVSDFCVASRQQILLIKLGVLGSNVGHHKLALSGFIVQEIG